MSESKSGSESVSVTLYELGTYQRYCIIYLALEPVLRIRIRRIRMFLGLQDPDPDPIVRGMDPDPEPDHSVTKQIK
jgi:hypothetical protein